LPGAGENILTSEGVTNRRMEKFESRGRSKFVMLLKYNCVEQMMHYKQSEVCSTHGSNEKCTQNYGRKT
jgi:hypothetical protein